MSKKMWETAGGVCSILWGLVCGWLAVTDRISGQSIWVVWVVMTFAVVINGVAMIRHAQRRLAGTSLGQRVHEVAPVRP